MANTKRIVLNDETADIGQFNTYSYIYNRTIGSIHLVIGKNVKNLVGIESSYCGTGKVEKITVEDGNTNFSSINGVLFNADETTLLLYPSAKTNTDYKVPDSVITIGPYAFQRTNSLKNVVLGTNTKHIEESAFEGSSINSIIFNDNIETIGKYAFSGCSKLKEVILPKSVRTIKAEAFCGCWSLEKFISYSEDLKTEGRILERDYRLTEIEIHHQLKKTDKPIGLSSYATRMNIIKTPRTEIKLKPQPHGTKSELDSVIHDGVKLNLPVQAIYADHLWNLVLTLDSGSYSHTINAYDDGIDFKYTLALFMIENFNNTDARKYVEHHADNIAVAYAEKDRMDEVRKVLAMAKAEKLAAVQRIANIKGLTNLLSLLEGYEIKEPKPKTKPVESYVNPDGSIKRPKRYVHSNHQTNTEWTSIMNLGEKSADRKYVLIHEETINIQSPKYSAPPVVGVRYIEVEENNKAFKSVDGVLFSKDMTKLILYPPARKDTEYIIPDGVTTICANAFAMAKSLEKVVMPDSVTHIEMKAFRLCRNLHDIKLSSNLTNIEALAFNECVSLREIVFPESVRDIGCDVVYKCKALESIAINSKNVTLAYNTISGVENLKKIILRCPASEMCKGSSNVLDKSKNLTEFEAPGVLMKMSSCDAPSMKKLDSIEFNNQIVNFNSLYIFTSNIPYVASMITSGDYGEYKLFTPWGVSKMNIKYAIAITLYKTTHDEKARLYIHRQFKPIAKSCIDDNNIKVIKDIVTQTTKENINDLIAYAREQNKTEIQVILEKYKSQNFESKALKL